METESKPRPGRPRRYSEKIKQRPFGVTPSQLAKATALGDGNASLGVQRAIDAASLPLQAPATAAEPTSAGASLPDSDSPQPAPL